MKPLWVALVIAILCGQGPAAFFLDLRLERDNAGPEQVVTDRSWLAADREFSGWEQSSFNAAGWFRAALGPAATQTQGESQADVAITPLDNYEQWRQATGAGPGTDPATFRVRPGFEIERLRSAQPGEGSWIALAVDPQGRIIIAKETKGLLRLTLPGGSEPPADRSPDGQSLVTSAATGRVESINETLEEVRGLLFVQGSLYANANRSRGLFRLRDTTGDGQFNDIKMLGQTRAGGHGRNDLCLGPDGMIYLMHGDDVDLPPGTHKLTPPIVPRLLPGENHSHGHLIRIDLDGDRWELVSSGLRNPFGVDFNSDGEAFTYDADAEHDMGAPWYRPTHVRHLVSGADFAWRPVTGRWPPYYPDHADNPPVTLVLGKGSPTAVKFGTRSHFPPAYQRALFVLDWAYGRIIAVHLTPRGASYAARAETFLRGRPLNVTGLDFGPDGAMYFVTGGRQTQSALYRVRYTGSSVVEPAPSAQDRAGAEHALKARARRRQLEAFHGRQDLRAIDVAWPFLDDPDPWIAHAARVAIEHQPAASWSARALNEASVAKGLPALMALARVGPDAVLPPILQRLAGLPIESQPRSKQLVALRAGEMALLRLGRMSRALRNDLIARWDRLFPGDSPEVNREAAKLLLWLEAPGTVPRILSLLEDVPGQEDQLHYLFLLRNARGDWTDSDRARYFRALARTESFRGGAGMPKFLQQIRTEALAAIPELDRPKFSALLESSRRTLAEIPTVPESRPWVKKWTMAELAGGLGNAERGGDLERGKTLFAVARCVLCHQFGEQGRPVGPDLTGIAGRFNRRDILEAILDPSRVVSEIYRNVVITTKQGAIVTGRVGLEGDYRLPVLRVAANPFAPDQYTEVLKDDIVSYKESPVSPMPDGLLDTLTRSEIADLIAYLETGGSP